MKDRKKWTLFAVVTALSLIADQVTKIWARGLPMIGHGTGDGDACVVPDDLVTHVCQGKNMDVVGSFWKWRLSMNTGSAFGLFSSQTGARVFLSIVGIVAVIGMVFMLRKSRPDQKVLHWALALVAGGAVGNLIDRMYFGVVTDFILWHLGEFKAGVHAGTGRWAHEWPVFNIADIVLVVGVGLMFIDIQKEGRREKALKAGRQSKAKAAGLIKDFGK